MTPRPAATLIPVRDWQQGLEVFMMRRTEHAAFMAGAYVFPGGAIEQSDSDAAWQGCCVGLDDREASRRLALPSGGLAYFVGAIRECFEESGILFAYEDQTRLVRIADTDRRESFAALRRQLNEGNQGFAHLCRLLGLTLAADRLAYLSHWITPHGSPRRYDTRFFVAVAPPGQTPSHDASETVDHFWVRPEEALGRHKRGEIKIAFATMKTLEALACFDDTAALMEHLRTPRTIAPLTPRIAAGRSGRRVLIQDDYAYAEVGKLDPAGHGQASYEILPGVPTRLSERVTRIAAPNAGFMTGPGTNTYLIGSDEIAVIDPGPDTGDHLRVILEETGGRIGWILVTHTHPDHSPAAARLKAETGARTIGLPPPAHERQDQSFRPDVVPADGERLRVAGTALRVIHTPGHASNHVCYLLEEEKLLFTGDHLMQGSTVVINPPDGNMAVYLASLRRLLDEDLEWLAPGHGFLMDKPRERIERVLVHRLGRESKVFNALNELGEATLEMLLPRVYDDVPARIHPVAARSLLAHLIKLRDEGRAESADGRWRA